MNHFAGDGGIDGLLAIMTRLRDPARGCPWDVQQTFASIAAYTIEEAYEVADAIARNDLPALKDELGDLLLQVVFHARMAQEQGAFGFDDVVAAISGKLLRRHPHVFAAAPGPNPGDAGLAAPVADAAAQTVAWEAHKRRERDEAGEHDTSALAGIARGVPEWQRAVKLQKRAAAVGFDWPGITPVIAKLHEEIEEVRVEFAALAALADQAGLDGADADVRDPDESGPDARDPDARGPDPSEPDPSDPDQPERDPARTRDRLEDEIGDVLFVCANLARHGGVDVGSALRRANRKFERRFRAMEAAAAADGTKLGELPLDAQEAYWQRIKAEEPQ